MRLISRNDLDFVAVFDFVGQWHDPPVDFGTTASVSILRVHVIGEIELCRTGRHFDHIAFRADRIDAILENVVADLVE